MDNHYWILSPKSMLFSGKIVALYVSSFIIGSFEKHYIMDSSAITKNLELCPLCLVWKSPEILNNLCLKGYFAYLCHANKTLLHFINHSSISAPQGWIEEAHVLILMTFSIIKQESSSETWKRETFLSSCIFFCERHMRGKRIYNVLNIQIFCHILDLTKEGWGDQGIINM